MRIELSQAPTPEEMGPRSCCACGRLFEQGPALARLISDDGVDVGVVCPVCLEQGPGHIEEQMRLRAFGSRLKAAEDEQLASENIEEMPTSKEYMLFTELFDGPRHRSKKETEANDPNFRDV